jgi:hypothetical protein
MNKQENLVKSRVALHSIESWSAVVDFLLSLNFKQTRNIHISRKSEAEWVVQTEVDETPKHPIRLTTPNRRVGLFDLNW